MAGGRPKLFKKKEDLEQAIDRYKDYLKENNRPPTIAGLAYYTGIDRKTLYNYSKDDEFFPTIKKLVDWIIMNYEEIAIDKGNGGIVFLLKNYGYTDKQEHDINGELKVEVKWQ
jgi:hypothetical protein